MRAAPCYLLDTACGTTVGAGICVAFVIKSNPAAPPPLGPLPAWGGSRCVWRYALVDKETARALYGARGFDDMPAHHFKAVLEAHLLKAEFQCVLATWNGRCGKHQALACASKVAASLTSNLPGPSTFKVATLPSLTSME